MFSGDLGGGAAALSPLSASAIVDHCAVGGPSANRIVPAVMTSSGSTSCQLLLSAESCSP
jgi:hypothetical protein